MLRLFLLTLFSSWIVNPLGVAVAHHFNIANSPVVVLLLLGIGACVPFQLFMNECLAAGKLRGQFEVTGTQLAMVLGMQTVAYILCVTWFSKTPFNAWEIGVLGLFLILYTFLSYRGVLIFYRLATHGVLTSTQAALVGVLPGLSSLCIYAGYCFAMQWWPDIPRSLLLLACPIPAVLVWWLIQSMDRAPAVQQPSPCAPAKTVGKVGNLNLTAMASLLAIFSMLASTLRESIAMRGADHAALILVGLNALMSITNTFTRSSFLSKGGMQLNRLLLLGMVATLLLSLVSIYFSMVIFQFSILASTQFLIMMLIENGRKMRPSVNS